MTSITSQGITDLHQMTMDTYRHRIRITARANGTDLTEELVDQLARTMDLSAAERVLDEAEYTDTATWEHPMHRAVRDRLSHAEGIISALIGVPAALRDALSHTAQPSSDQTALLDTMDAAMRAARGGVICSGVSQIASETVNRTLDVVVEQIETRARMMVQFHRDETTKAISEALFDMADVVDLIRHASFKPADHWKND